MAALLEGIASEEFMPHAMCLLWKPELVWLHAVSDGLTALAYYGIPVVIIYFAWKRKDLVFRHVFLLSGIFVLACGTTHAMGVWTLWNPDYLTDGLIKAGTAAVSLTSLAAMWQAMPRALALPSPTQLSEANAALGREVEERQAAEAQVKRLNAELEERVDARTAELEQANAELRRKVDSEALLLREVHHRVKNNLQIISSMLRLQADTADDHTRGLFLPAQQRITVMARMHEELYASHNMAGVRFDHYVAELCEDLGVIYGVQDRVHFEVLVDPLAFGLDTATPLALILNEAVTNACKHAFPEGRSGTVRVSLTDCDGTVEVDVRDDGVGMQGGRQSDSMGSLLVESLAQQLDGTVSVNTQAGTQLRVTFPASYEHGQLGQEG